VKSETVWAKIFFVELDDWSLNRSESRDSRTSPGSHYGT
jgi:hypothetical protein